MGAPPVGHAITRRTGGGPGELTGEPWPGGPHNRGPPFDENRERELGLDRRETG